MVQLRFPNVGARWLPASAAALLWALAAASALLWWLHAPRQDAALDAPVSVTQATPVTQGGPAVARALGHTGAVAQDDAQQRFQLLGVIAAHSGQGSALLAVDGQPAQAFIQGQAVAEGWRLQAVRDDGVRLSAGQGGATLELALPSKP